MQTEINTAIKAAPGAEKLFDLCMINQLCRGNRDQVLEMLGVFIEEMPQAVEDIKTAYENNDFKVVKNVAHRIKPVLSYYAVVKIERDMLQIEALALEGKPNAELEQRIKKLETVIIQIVEQMKEMLLY